MPDIQNYEEQVYAGLLGKTIGVYMGRPFEQWHRPAIAEKWGIIDRYVHEDQVQRVFLNLPKPVIFIKV